MGTWALIVRNQEPPAAKAPWCLVGNGGMDIGDYSWRVYREYYRIHSPTTKNQAEGRKLTVGSSCSMFSTCSRPFGMAFGFGAAGAAAASNRAPELRLSYYLSSTA